MKCPFCGFESDDQAKTCDHCKAAIPHETNKTDDEPVKGKRKNKE